MLDKIEDNPFISLGIANLIVAVLFFDAFALNLFSVLFAAFALFAFYLNVTTVEKVISVRRFPDSGKKELVTISNKEVNSFIKSHVAEVTTFIDSTRDGIFISHAEDIYTPSQLNEMAQDENPRVQALAALDERISVSSLEALSHSKNLGVLNAVASNPRTPKDIKNHILYSAIFDLSSESSQRELLEDPETPEYALRQIYTNPYNEKKVFAALVKNVNTPKDVFDEITEGENIDVLTSIASSPAVVGNKDLISKLRKWISYDIAAALFANPLVDTNTLDMYDIASWDRATMNTIIRDKDIKLSNSTMAWVARKAPAFKPAMVERMKAESPELADFPSDVLLKLY